MKVWARLPEEPRVGGGVETKDKKVTSERNVITAGLYQLHFPKPTFFRNK
jgi:hypothetical protein